MSEEAYQCNDIKCGCQDLNNYVKHCPQCGELYFYDSKHPELPCIDCRSD